ncbi:MAG: methylenetetrahydrofolate reductase C-terminal domain-containing protein [Lentisphaeria bacterium]|nr:methylenetetrahydrofolate reductase C-terminal domain-containing protein [Lentisphaeria bacterium]
MSELQLDMQLAGGGNPFRDALAEGKFIFLAECSPPENETRCAAAAERILPLIRTMIGQNDLCGGAALTDRRGAPWSAMEISAALPEELRRHNLGFLSGDGRDAAAVQTQLDLARNSGAVNVVPVSGDAAPLSLRECRARNYCGSTEQLRLMQDQGLFAGAVFNPFHYDADTVLASFNALSGKIAAGAQFIIAQSGWDMLQNQTLAWYLLRRKQFIPLLAHLTLLTPDRAEKIASGRLPGLRMTPAFRKLIARELLGSKAQFEAAQYRRLELQVAGCRLMGYSGVIVSGVDVPGRAALVASRIRSALQEFRNFDHWLGEYNEHQAPAEMSYGVDAYHLFDRFLRRQYPFDEPPEITEPEEPDFSWAEQFSLRLKRFLFAKADRRRPERDILLKKLLADCRSCARCTLPEHHFYCTRTCPKRLENGPCGGVRDDGTCEIGGGECVFVRIMRCERHLARRPGLES